MKKRFLRKKQNQKGITLIALVVTIVVLLILAGISIAMLTGENGIISKAQNAKQETHIAEDKENIDITLVQGMLESKYSNYAELFNTLSWCESATYDETKGRTHIIMKKCNHEYFVYDDGRITDAKEIVLDKNEITLQLKSGQTVTDIISAEWEGSEEITWTISDSTIASLSTTTGKSITITAIKEGEATITATSGKYSSSCKIIVKEEAPQVQIVINSRKIDSVSITVNVGNRENTEIQEYKYYIKPENAEDTEYVEFTGESNTCTFTGIRNLEKYIVKVEVTDTKGNQGSATKNVDIYCFVAGTKVLTENGMKNIEDIQIGEKVYTINLDTNQKELKEVQFLIRSIATEIYEITIGDEVIKTTEKHQFYVVDKGWIRANELEHGDKIVAKDNTSLEITNIEIKNYEEPIEVYNLTIDAHHNYLITQYELLVHNATSPS